MVDPPAGGLWSRRIERMLWVYVLKSQTTEKIYIGYTSNLTLRLKRHNQKLPAKKGSYTQLNQGPWEIVYKEKCSVKKEAMEREKQLKSAKGREFIRKKVLRRT